METGKQIKPIKQVQSLDAGVRAVVSGPGARNAFRLATTAGVTVAVVGAFGAGPAAADPASLTLRYTCSTSVIDDVSVTVEIDSDVPESAEVGKPTPKFAFNAAVPVTADQTELLNTFGVKTLVARADAKVRVAAPEGGKDVHVPVNARTTVPASGPFRVRAAGTAPALTFRQPGTGKIAVGNVAAHLVAKDADGDVKFEGDARCKRNAGQRNVLASFHITKPKATDGASNSGTPTGSSGPGTTASKRHVPLASTGAEAVPWLLGGAAVLLAAGGGAIFAARRSRRDDG